MKQQRHTKQRQIVLDAVRTRRDHPSAEQIYLDVRAVDGKISRSTVYRNLNILAEDGEILQIGLFDTNRFDLRTDSHYHFLCTECGLVCDAPVGYHEELDTQVARVTGHAIKRHRTIFEGACAACLRKEELNKGEFV